MLFVYFATLKEQRLTGEMRLFLLGSRQALPLASYLRNKSRGSCFSLYLKVRLQFSVPCFAFAHFLGSFYRCPICALVFPVNELYLYQLVTSIACTNSA